MLIAGYLALNPAGSLFAGYIFEPACNVLFYYMEKPIVIPQKQNAGIVTSLNDTTPTKVTYGKYATWIPYGVAYGMYERLSSQ